MSRVIRISESLYKKLESMAVGFDTPTNVIERLVRQQEGENLEQDNVQPKLNKITTEIIETAYLQAKDVYANKTSIVDAQSALVDDLGMHPGSARDYINNFQKMMSGECYQRTMNGNATEYYLEKIYADFGKEKLKKALFAVEQHIQYYETFSNGKLRNIREIHKKFSKLV